MNAQETKEQVNAFVDFDLLIVDAKNAADVSTKDDATFYIAEQIRTNWYEQFPDESLDENALCELIESQLQEITFEDGVMIYA